MQVRTPPPLIEPNADELELGHILSAGGAISTPSLIPNEAANPSGLIYNYRSKLMVSITRGSIDTDAIDTGARFYTGNGLVGAEVGIQSLTNIEDQSGALTYISFGIGALAEPLKTSFGMSGRYRAQMKGNLTEAQSDTSWYVNFGALYNPNGPFRIGLMLYDISSGIKAYGTGLSLNLNKFAVISTDMSVNKDGRGFIYKPTLTAMSTLLQISYGYGVRGDSYGSLSKGISAGNTIGLGVTFTPNFQLNANYNQFSLFSVDAIFKF